MWRWHNIWRHQKCHFQTKTDINTRFAKGKTLLCKSIVTETRKLPELRGWAPMMMNLYWSFGLSTAVGRGSLGLLLVAAIVVDKYPITDDGGPYRIRPQSTTRLDPECLSSKFPTATYLTVAVAAERRSSQGINILLEFNWERTDLSGWWVRRPDMVDRQAAAGCGLLKVFISWQYPTLTDVAAST